MGEATRRGPLFGKAAAAVLAAFSFCGTGCLNVQPETLRSSSSGRATSPRAASPRRAARRSTPLQATAGKAGDIRIPTHYDARDPARNPDAVIEELLRGANR